MTASPKIRLLAVSGSLRKQSVNTAVLEAARSLATGNAEVSLYSGLTDLPHFNPDLDTEQPPGPVVHWRAEVKAAAGLLICSPEYAHGIPGVLKNALDWLVSDANFVGKPVALINARPRATWAMASLKEILSVMKAELVEPACVTLPLTTNALTAADLLAQPDVRTLLRLALEEMFGAIVRPNPGRLDN